MLSKQRALAAVALGLTGCGVNMVEPIGARVAGAGGAGGGGDGPNLAGTTASGGELSRGLVAYWKLDETGSSEAAIDSVGAHSALPINDPLSSTDVPSVTFGDAASRTFDGQGQYLRIASTDDLNFSGEITLAAWVKVAMLGTECQYIVGHGYCKLPPGEVVLRIGVPGCGPGQAPNFWAAGTWLSAEYSATAPVLDSDVGVWVHVAGTYADQAWHLYRNGQEIATQPSVVGAVPVQNDWSIGARAPGLPPCMPEGAERFFNGS